MEPVVKGNGVLSQGWGEDIFPRLYWFRMDRVKDASVMVVGCGALGNEVLKNLAMFGVGHLVLVDLDDVEYSNLTRSVLFTSEDAGAHESKVDAASRSINRINPHVQVRTIKGDISWQVGLGLIRKMDVVVGCLDNRWARYALNRLCMRAGVPWVDGGINALDGVVKVFIPGRNCYACTMDPSALKELSRGRSCAAAVRRDIEAERVPTTPVVASVIGAVQAQEAMKLIHKDELERGELTSLCGRMFCYEGQHLTTRIVTHAGWDEDCPVHECWTPAEKSDLTTDATVAQTLDALKEMLHTDTVEIMLRNHKWVEFLEHKETGEKYPVMMPEAMVPSFIEGHPELRYRAFREFFQKEYGVLDVSFPYKDLTLVQIGIPDMDVLHVRTGEGDRYIELADHEE